MHTIRTQTECVMDMAMDSALAEYHRELLEQYLSLIHILSVC